MNLNDYDLGWVAGYLEGEGSFIKKKNGNPEIQVISTEVESLEKLQILLGGSLYGPYTSSHESILKITKNPKPYWRWCIQKKNDAKEMMILLKPFLSKRRQKQIEKII